MRASSWFIAGLALLAAATPHAATGPQQAGRAAAGEPQPVSVDFVAVTRDGRPADDLKAADVALRIDGKARPVKSLEFVRFAGSQTAAEPIVPAFITNAAPEAVRSFLMIVDDESVPIGQEHKLREAMSRWIQELPASDRVALVTVPNGGVKVDLTADRERLRKGIAEITPITSVVNAACRARSTLVTLRNTFETFGRVTGQPLIAVFFSATMLGASEMQRSVTPNAATGVGGLSLEAGACNVHYDDFKAVGQAAAEAHVITYVMHPDFNPLPATAGIENLRSVTGAPLLHLSGTAGVPGLTRLAQEMGGYYRLTFDTEAGERLGGVSHQLDVKSVVRKDIDIRVRPQIVLTPTRAVTPDTGVASFANAFELIRSGRSFRDLPLRATTLSARGTEGAINVIAWFDSADPAAKLTSAAAALFDGEGRGVAYWRSQPGDLTGSISVVGLLVPKGRYRLRIGAIDAGGRYGVIDDMVTAELGTAGPLTMSGLSFGVSRSAGFQPRFQFSTEASALAHLEFYGGVAGTPVSALFEVSETTDGPPLFRVPGAISPTPDDDRFTVTGAIPVGILPPGDYVIRAIVGVQGKSSGRVLRTLHKAGG
jgi:hypothetical protein